MLLSSQSFTRIMLIFFIGVYLISFINETNADETRMQKISNFSIDINEVTIGDFYRFVTSTNYKTKAERRGWGYVYEFGWVQKRGWNWKNPYGVKGEEDEPAVHVNFDEAQMFCHWSNKRLPNENEWILAAYTEKRNLPSQNFIKGKTYPFPVGEKPFGANCLNDCDFEKHKSKSNVITRGYGHSKVKVSKKGVNGLYDMGANVWEWANIKNKNNKATKGGSWWYGKEQMHSNHMARKDRNMSAVYIGFRCIKQN